MVAAVDTMDVTATTATGKSCWGCGRGGSGGGGLSSPTRAADLDFFSVWNCLAHKFNFASFKKIFLCLGQYCVFQSIVILLSLTF